MQQRFRFLLDQFVGAEALQSPPDFLKGKTVGGGLKSLRHLLRIKLVPVERSDFFVGQ